jgi:hypothetical protein
MNDNDPADSHETPPTHPVRPEVRRVPLARGKGLAVAGALLVAVIGLSVALTTSPSASADTTTPGADASSAAPTPGPGGGPVSGPAAGGAVGLADSVSMTGLILTTAMGQQVTVTETSTTTYLNGTDPASVSDVVSGASLLVLGVTDGTTMTATQITVQPGGDGGVAAAAAAGVVAFQPGVPSVVKQVGQIPPSYSQGAGTIVSGSTADQATEAALAVYPGGVVDRVVELSDGYYEVHNIGVNWPHHLFVDPNFTVVGAE